MLKATKNIYPMLVLKKVFLSVIKNLKLIDISLILLA